MDQNREYGCKCRVCGVEHTVRASFMFSDEIMGDDGTPRLASNCGKHTAEEVRAAYLAAREQ